jgi:hypothetical protein
MKSLKLILSTVVLTTAVSATAYAAPNPPFFPTLQVAPGGIVSFFIRSSPANGLPTGTVARCNINSCGTSNNNLLITNHAGGVPLAIGPGVPTGNCVFFNGDIDDFCACEVSALLVALGGTAPEPGQTDCSLLQLLPPPYGAIPPSH